MAPDSDTVTDTLITPIINNKEFKSFKKASDETGVSYIQGISSFTHFNLNYKMKRSTLTDSGKGRHDSCAKRQLLLTPELSGQSSRCLGALMTTNQTFSTLPLAVKPTETCIIG